MRFDGIPQFPTARYTIDVEWRLIESVLEGWKEGNPVDLCPDYQRGHVWTLEQQVAYMEYMLRGGEVGRDIIWNCPGFPDGGQTIELVDGLQRLTAVRAWFRDEVPTFGIRFSEFEGHIRTIRQYFKFKVCAMTTRVEILQLYLNINAGGTPHSAKELRRVKELLSKEKKRESP